ncbi:hypothetical protein RR42_s3291 [Cupriavidus basilensis]|uniref:Uncharacterized protein n=1 Tax=Cupriavidus basilensis TaxID=68895 RepID=A0A0C4YG91_9BURK|nr:hypothetical protein RR42_s3291 [Cupriavidus basilensis]
MGRTVGRGVGSRSSLIHKKHKVGKLQAATSPARIKAACIGTALEAVSK